MTLMLTETDGKALISTLQDACNNGNAQEFPLRRTLVTAQCPSQKVAFISPLGTSAILRCPSVTMTPQMSYRPFCALLNLMHTASKRLASTGQLHPRDGKFKHWFKSENELRSIMAHNQHGHHSCQQWGGTAAMVMGQAASEVVLSGRNETGLGCWSWLLFQGANNHRTQLMSACCPCDSHCHHLHTVCNQQCHCF